MLHGLLEFQVLSMCSYGMRVCFSLNYAQFMQLPVQLAHEDSEPEIQYVVATLWVMAARRLLAVSCLWFSSVCLLESNVSSIQGARWVFHTLHSQLKCVCVFQVEIHRTNEQTDRQTEPHYCLKMRGTYL